MLTVKPSSAPISIIPKHSGMTSARRPAAVFDFIIRNTSKSNSVALAQFGAVPCHSSFNQEVMFVTVLGKWIKPFLYGWGWGAWEIQYTAHPHALWMWCWEKKHPRANGLNPIVEQAKVGSFLTSQLDHGAIGSRDMSDTMLQKRRIKAGDTSQQSLERNKINVQSRVFIKGLPVLRSWLKLTGLPLPPSQWK